MTKLDIVFKNNEVDLVNGCISFQFKGMNAAENFINRLNKKLYKEFYNYYIRESHFYSVIYIKDIRIINEIKTILLNEQHEHIEMINYIDNCTNLKGLKWIYST